MRMKKGNETSNGLHAGIKKSKRSLPVPGLCRCTCQCDPGVRLCLKPADVQKRLCIRPPICFRTVTDPLPNNEKGKQDTVYVRRMPLLGGQTIPSFRLKKYQIDACAC